MITTRFRELMTQGFSLSNKLYFGELGPHEFNRWIEDCRNLLSRCEPEPCFLWFPDHRHIEEIVMLLHKVQGQILRREIRYMGLP